MSGHSSVFVPATIIAVLAIPLAF